MTTRAELDRSFAKLQKTALQVKRERDHLYTAAQSALRFLRKKDATAIDKEQVIDWLEDAIEEANQ